ncbi:T9SS type A sorting domain-containing protein [Jejudonia soesokkakensis]|uniref:T9SS type A sorting domain-containing protein n=1 Tax=Jejudonia soesokkakensis TaxID=1323432 RepID=A0ABW2MRE4_9FLAO
MKLLYTLLLSAFVTPCFAQLNFMQPIDNTPVANTNVPIPITASIGYQGYDETQEYFGQGEYEIFLDTADGILDQPILILDGFDPGDSRNIDGLYNSLNFDNQNLADVLREEGYDIVILNPTVYTTDGNDIDGGADYIQRNAMVLVELISIINDLKESDAGLVVLGPSMGGLIARYGLAYMEQNNLEHETRLYISFDSPHKGANIPISLQYLINYLAESFDNEQAQAIVAQVLNSAAAKEMLYDHLLAHLADGSTFEQNPMALLPEGAPDFRDAFQSELDELGFPQNVRNVAMVNGSGNGTIIGMPGIEVINTNLQIAGPLNADVILHFTPEANETIEVTYFESFVASASVDTFTADAMSLPTIDGIDAAPGGKSQISNALGDANGNQVIIDFVEALDQDDFSFIPVISALALENEDDWYALPDIGNTHTSAFVNTFIPSENENHVSVTAESAQFAIDEIRNGSLGTSETSATTFSLIKNPISESLQIKINTAVSLSEVNIAIYNTLGQQLLTKTISPQNNEITIPLALKSGMYTVLVATEGAIQTLKFVVE